MELKKLTKQVKQLCEDMDVISYQTKAAISEYKTLNEDEIRRLIWWLYNQQNELQKAYEEYIKK